MVEPSGTLLKNVKHHKTMKSCGTGYCFKQFDSDLCFEIVRMLFLMGHSQTNG